jgi:Tannase-like family of unknown function (DUF6351)
MLPAVNPWGVIVRAAIIMALLASALAGPADAASKPTSKPQLSISILSGRADLVSGGSALVAVDLPPGSNPQRARVTLGGNDVTSAFAVRADGRFEGLVTGLALGQNQLQATLPGATGAKITLTNHPIGGPVLSGPQLQPWTCQSTAVDSQCNQPPTYRYVYKSTDPTKSGFQPYDPANPPSDVAQTTTDQRTTFPFIVRIETGYMDRDQYQVAALFQPGKPWTTFKPQQQFNHKLLILHGASCGVDYETGGAPDTTGSSSPTGDAGTYALGRGFVTMSTALDNSGHNCNLPLQAESLIMAKEYIAETYGTLRYTIGTGCSGGSLAAQWIANAYPGVYQGILPTCSFPDAWSTATQFLDYHLLLAYFKDPSKWGSGVLWLPTQMADVEGHVTVLNSEVSDNAQWHVAVPTDPCSGTTDANRYNAQTNPGGVRCSITDAAINVFGPNPQAAWSPPEQQIGRGYAVPPIDNVGVQYGLGALEKGQITPAQFVDLNTKIGGVDIDTNPTAARIDTGTAPALANAYRSGMINETNNLDQTAIIDCRGPDPGLFHDSYRAFTVRARLNRAHGGHANQLIWEGPAPIVGDAQCEHNSLIAMDRWLTAVEKDAGSGSLAQKLIRDKPSDLSDRCYDGAGQKLTDGLCPDPVVPVYGTPRMVAGDAITTDANKCQLKPLQRSDYALKVGPVPVPIPFTDTEWAQLQSIFAAGVCDFSKPGVAQQGTIPWQTYQDAQGNVIYGGTPLGPAPTSQPISP